jgi:hypothetical protein
MRGIILISFLSLSLILAGCGGQHYKLPKDEYRERVRVLGVLPLLVDDSSTILHPEREELLRILHRQNAGKEARLIEMLQQQKGYFDVRPVTGDPRQLLHQLVSGYSMRDKGPALYRRYHFNALAATELAQINMVDALLVVIFNGIDRPEKRWDRKSPAFLETTYNAVQVTAAVILPSGEMAWEYPAPAGDTFLHLQYPAFEEAFHNRIDEVKIHFISAAGLERTLLEPDGSLFARSPFPRPYRELFERIASALRPGLIHPLKSREAEAVRSR